MRKALSCALLAVSLLLTGCSYRLFPGKSVPEEAQPEPTVAPEAPAIVSETPRPASTNRVMVSYTYDWKQVFDEETGAMLLDYSCMLPHVELPEHPAAQKAIQQALDASTELYISGQKGVEGLPNGLRSMEDAARAQYAIPAERDWFYPYAMNRELYVARGDAAILSFVYTHYSFTGGAHGYGSSYGRVFDAETGRELTLADLSDDPEQLKSVLLTELKARCDAMKDGLNENYAEVLPSLLEGNEWYLSDYGLTVIANPYAIAAYASGKIEFSIPYRTMNGVLSPRYQRPEKAAVQGGLEADWADAYVSGVMEPLMRLDMAELSPFVLWADRTVYNVRLNSVVYEESTGTFSSVRELLFAGRMDDGEYIQVSASLPDVIPNLMLSWSLPDNTVQRYLISLSGYDGSLLLTDPSSLSMIQPGEVSASDPMYPFEWDLNGDGTAEYLSLRWENEMWRLGVSGQNGEVYLPTSFIGTPRCFVGDVDGDNCFELLICGETHTERVITQVWRYTDTLRTVAFTVNGETFGSLPCTVLGVDVDEVVLSGTVDILGSYTGSRPFSDGPDGTLSPAWESAWNLQSNTEYLTLLSDLVYSDGSGSTGRLCAGTRLRVISYDDVQVGFETDGGIRGYFDADKKPDGSLYVNGEASTIYFRVN